MYQIEPRFIVFNEELTNNIKGLGDVFYKQIGEVSFPTGKIVACDPLMLHEQAFTTTVKPGKYPVSLNILRMMNDDERVAYAMVQFSTGEAVRWEMAFQNGEDPLELAHDEFMGYSVDTGTGGFLDEQTVSALQAYGKQKYAQDSDYNLYDEIDEELHETYKDTRSWLIKSFPEVGDVALFSSGFGDGVYPSFWGYDEQGEIAYLVTDFLIIDEMLSYNESANE